MPFMAMVARFDGQILNRTDRERLYRSMKELKLKKEELLSLYETMVLIRKSELATQENYKKGEVPGFIHLYMGEEAIASGVCAHLRKSDWITSTHRGHGHALAKGVEPKSLMAELYGKATGCCGGRGGTMHIYSPKDGLFGTNGIVAGGLPLSIGLGISEKTKKTDNVTICFFGDGAVNHGAFHESVNLAGALNAPVVFVCENNLYATCLPLSATTKNDNVASKAAAYGIPGVRVDGNDVLDVYKASQEAIDRARKGQGPTLIEACTYRTVGHHEGDVLTGTYRTVDELESWKKKCPILKFEKKLLKSKTATQQELDAISNKMDEVIAEAVEFARKSPYPDVESVLKNSWAEPVNPKEALECYIDENCDTKTQNWLEAVRDAIAEEMRKDSNIILMGEGIGEREGSWGHTKNLWQEFGAERVMDTPISELGFTGACIAASATGCRAISDLMITDFLFDAASQIIDQASKLRYMSNGQINVPVILRSASGAIKQTGPHHSGAFHSLWANCPGLIVVMPSNPADAKGLMKTALRAKDPVVFLEPKTLLSSKGPVPETEYFIPFGQAKTVKQGQDLTVIASGSAVHVCLEASKALQDDGISCEIIDLRTIVPLDIDTIVRSISKTGKLLVVDDGFAMCGLGGEIAATVMEHAFDELDAPICRLHNDPVAQPFSPVLDVESIVNKEKVIEAAKTVIKGQAIIQHTPVTGLVKSSNVESNINTIDTSEEPAKETPAQIDTESLENKNVIEIVMPNQDLTVDEGTVVNWLKNIGDSIVKDEPVVEVETDKATFEVESPADGTLSKISVEEGTTVGFGTTLGLITIK